MRTRDLLALTAVLMAAAVGLAMVSTRSVADPQQEQRSRPPDRQMGPPQGPRGGGPGGLEPLLFELDLAAGQLEQVKALTTAQREAEAPSRDELRQIGEEMRALIEADTFDESAVRDLAAREAALTAGLRLAAARTESAIFQLLTADQKAALKKLRDQQPPRPRGR